MRTDLFDYDLPEACIALRPLTPRDAARLLHVRPQDAVECFQDHGVRDLPRLLRPGDALVFNNTRVLAALLQGVRRRGDSEGRVSINLLARRSESCWRALAKPARRLLPGDRVTFGHHGSACLSGRIEGTVVAKGARGDVDVAFDLSGVELDRAIDTVGAMPLPHYIASRRAPDDADRETYQTVFAKEAGAVAAPTAGLHFTSGLLCGLQAAGLSCHYVTLHVGGGTFLPVLENDTGNHKMHAEWGEISEATATALNQIRGAGGRIVAIGTTSLRILETAARDDHTIAPFSGETDIFITPGYRFKAVDRLVTNFHLPRSTLFMLVAAFSGLETMKAAYAHAIRSGYRFYSYGDACLLEPTIT